jgi:hypothetical protein
LGLAPGVPSIPTTPAVAVNVGLSYTSPATMIVAVGVACVTANVAWPVASV